MRFAKLPPFLAAIALWVACAAGAYTQEPARGRGAGAQEAGRGRGMRVQIQPADESAFRPIFDGKSLADWDGDTTFWRVENGVIVGETTTEKQPAQNTFLIWRGGRPADFELKVEYRLTGFNSGIQYRSVELPDIKWAMKGYQADMDAAQQFTGQIYEERGRGFLALRGQFTYSGEGKRPGIVGSLGDADELKKLIKTDDWNNAHVIARDHTLIQLLNGRVMSMLIDDDKVNGKWEGLIGIQLHRGPAMKIEVRSVRLKTL